MEGEWRRSDVPRINTRRVPSGRVGTLRTAELIVKLIRAGARDFCVRQTAITIFRAYDVRSKDRLGEVWALFDWVRRNIRYTRDIFQVELLHSARRMLQLRAGDCDDMTILLGAMLLSTGHPVRVVLAGYRRDRPHVYTHVYPQAKVRGRWISLDATMPYPMGWAPPAPWKRTCDIGKEARGCSPVTS